MPYNPSLPANATRATAAEMRGQLAGLKELIDAVSGVTSAEVDGVTPLNPGEPATATVSVTGSVLHISFGIPRGNDGGQGGQGEQGVQGPPISSGTVDGVSTLNPGENATVSVSFDGTTLHFSFGIPRGAVGEQGIQGIQGPVGEVSSANLANGIATAIAGTSSNTNGVALLNLMVSDPPTQAEVQSLAAKLDELITALRR